jgi:hypothetical protein
MRHHTRRPILALACLLLSATSTAAQERRVGRVSFFGQDGFDTAAIRRALPIREGDVITLGSTEDEARTHTARLEQEIRAAVRGVTGREPVAVNSVCCDERGGLLVYIGLPGESIRQVRYNRAPDGNVSLPAGMVRLREEVDALQFKAIAQGRAAEDHSQGYALSSDDAELRARQLAWRDEVRLQAALVFEVLRSSADARQRAIAAMAAGYARPDGRQIDALAEASFDADEGVRNNAVRALAVLIMARPDRATQVPAARFVDLLCSSSWSDRNKGLMLLQALTAARDAALLRELRARAWTSLLQMAEWPKGHAVSARLILGRIAGIPDAQLPELVNEEPADRLLRAILDATGPGA